MRLEIVAVKTTMIKLVEKYKLLSVQVKAALWYTLCSIIQKSLAFLVTPIFTRIMSKDDYGLYTVYNSWYWVVVVFATLNLYNGIFNNGMQKYKESRDQYTSILQSFGTVAAIICYCIYLPFNRLVEEQVGLNLFLCSLMFLQSLFTPALYYWQGRQRYEYKYQRMIIVTVAIAVLRPLISAIAVIVSHDKGVARVVSFVTFEIVIGLAFYIYNLFKGKKYFDKSIWKSAFLFAIPLIPHYLSQTFLTNLDKIMIDRYCGRSFVAVYDIAYTVAMVAVFINTSINNSLIPWLYDHLEKKDLNEVPRVTNGLIVIVGIINIFIILFSKEIVIIMGGKDYSEAAYLVPILGWSVFFMFLYSLFGDVEFYYKKTTYTMYGSLIACILNAALNVVFIKCFGYQAAAYTTLASYAALAVAHYYFVKKIEMKEKMANVFNYSFILAVSLIGTVGSMLSKLLYYNDYIRYFIICGVFTIVLVNRKSIIKYYNYIIKSKGKN